MISFFPGIRKSGFSKITFCHIFLSTPYSVKFPTTKVKEYPAQQRGIKFIFITEKGQKSCYKTLNLVLQV
jgi:hypothetical protein